MGGFLTEVGPVTNGVVDDVAGQLLDVWTGWIAANPLLAAAVGVAVALAWLTPFVARWLAPRRDPVRRFSASQRRAIFDRAGSRCEHKPLLGPRCAEVPTHGDHVYPWSRGGATVLSNAQALCARHNRRKGARVPGAWYLRRLQRRRRDYFPPGEDPEVVWRRAGDA
ncbi:HNH endonuclease [Isoptericola haloaureus]|uniref:HNH endonuclease n=1 Tax=Isoptericola haloaureus TaxID=1542902 RepID=A0ABU7Z6V2_9MICO